MNTQSSNWHKYFIALSALVLSAALPAQAQRAGGGGGGGFGGGFGGARGGSSSSTSQYPTANKIGDAYFSIDPESRRVVTIADEETSLAISQVLSNLDRPKPQVLIKVVFLEVTHNNASDIGIEGAWGKGIGGGNSASANQGFGLTPLSTGASTNINPFGAAISSFAPISPMTSEGAGLYSVLGANYTATLRAIASAGNAKILSRPSILARNNQPATITVGEQVPLITAVNYTTFGNTINSITYESVGVILQVTPFITSEGLVEMIVAPQISSIDPTLSIPISANVNAPVINVRSANTVVVTPNGQTVIIGGLMESTKSKNQTKIPLLGDIPLLGSLFKHTQINDVKTELIIFLTPYIAQNPTEMVAITGHEKQRSDIEKSFTEQELNKFLETLPSKDKAAPRH